MLITLRVNHSTRGWMSPELTPHLSASPEGLILCCLRRVVLKSVLAGGLYIRPAFPGNTHGNRTAGRTQGRVRGGTALCLRAQGVGADNEARLELQGTHHKLVSSPSD